MKKFYAGIGSRETPLSVKPLIERIVKLLNEKGFVLRSGGADGADTFFERFAEQKEIYLPWKGFNGNESELYESLPEATRMAEKHHPAYDMLTLAGKALMDRNSHQVFGKDMKTPVEFVVCWTKDGKASGGTGQAIRIANAHGIVVYNLFKEKDVELLLRRLNTASIF